MGPEFATALGASPAVRRIAAAILWLYAAWYAGSAIAMLIGVPDLLGPVLGLTAGLIVGVDPRHLIWMRASRVAATFPA